MIPNLNFLFEKKEDDIYTLDAMLCHDILSYYLNIDEENKQFSLRQLQMWLVNNNHEIVQSFQGFAGRMNAENKINAKRDRIDNKFKALIDLGLIKSVDGIGETSGSLYTTKKSYVFTKSGILVRLILKSMYLERQIEMEKNQISSLAVELDKNNYEIYEIIDSSLPIEDTYPYSNIYYKSLYKKVKDEGIFGKLVSHIVDLCHSKKRIIENVEYLLQFALEFDFKSREDHKRFSQLQFEVLEALKPEIRDIILYEIKLSVEGKFQKSRSNLSREYEKQRFILRDDHRRIVLEGYCEKCKQHSVVIWSYIDYKKKLIDVDYSNNIRYNCPKCKTNDGCIIPDF